MPSHDSYFDGNVAGLDSDCWKKKLEEEQLWWDLEDLGDSFPICLSC